jgi:hypothetical protein
MHRTAALIPLLLLTACASRPDPLPGFPRVFLWAWERPEDLTSIDARSVGVAAAGRGEDLSQGYCGVCQGLAAGVGRPRAGSRGGGLIPAVGRAIVFCGPPTFVPLWGGPSFSVVRQPSCRCGADHRFLWSANLVAGLQTSQTDRLSKGRSLTLADPPSASSRRDRRRRFQPALCGGDGQACECSAVAHIAAHLAEDAPQGHCGVCQGLAAVAECEAGSRGR